MELWIWWLLGLCLSVIVYVRILHIDRNISYTFLTVIYAGYILSSNILAPRLINVNLGLGEMVIVTGSLIWPFTAQLSDMLNEIFGRNKALIAVIFAYVLNLLFITFIYMASKSTPIWSATEENFWLSYFKPSTRIFVASSMSFMICQAIDIYVFSFLKEKFRNVEKKSNYSKIAYLGALRSLTSDVINMLFDGFIFSMVAFAFVLPKAELWSLVVGSITAKILLAALDTPLYIIFRLAIKDIEREA